MREVDPQQADDMKQPLLQALRDMDANVQECVDMLRKLPDVYAQLQGKLGKLDEVKGKDNSIIKKESHSETKEGLSAM